MTESKQSKLHQRLDHIPPEILCAQDYEALAHHFIEPTTLAYIEGGSEKGDTLVANRKAYNHWSLMPQLLTDVSQGNTRLNLPGMSIPHPFLLAPVAYQKLVHPEGELATAMAAEATDTPMILSTLSSQKLETIAQQCSTNIWFQLYFQAQRKDTSDLIKRAEAAGYQAIVITLDAIIQTPDFKTKRSGFVLPTSISNPNTNGYSTHQPDTSTHDESRIFRIMMQQAPKMEDISWLIQKTNLPVLIKGILNPHDAVKLKQLGVDGLVVSNHGGRSLDGLPASLSMLPTIRQAVGENYPLLMDGGIRSGRDIFKALALGANAVLIGRLQMYALAVAGALGVGHMIRLLTEELEIAMATCGCENVASINRENIVKNEN